VHERGALRLGTTLLCPDSSQLSTRVPCALCQPGVERPCSCPRDEEEYAAQEHRIINPGLMRHGPKTVFLKNRKFGCCYRNQHVYDEGNGSQSSKKAREKKPPANNLHYAHKGSHDFRRWNADLDKAANTQVLRKEELLYAFGKEHPADNKPNQDDGA
jgi:hypothetical protein